MRTIKFREPIFNNDGSFNKFHYWGFHEEGSFTGICVMDIAKEKSQEYTGLKDKKGVEIYEGDIVKTKIDDGFWDCIYSGVIEFDIGCFSVCMKKRKVIGNIDNKHDSWSYDIGQKPALFEFIDELEIIGNIYENPKLLKQ